MCKHSRISNIQKFHFNVVIHIVRKSKMTNNSLNGSPRVFGPRLLQYSQNVRFQNHLRFPKSIFSENSGFLWTTWTDLVSEIVHSWCWESWSHPPGPKTMEMMSFQMFPTWILKVTSPRRNRIILRSFLTILFFKIQSKNAPPPRPQSPQTPNPDLFPDVLQDPCFRKQRKKRKWSTVDGWHMSQHSAAPKATYDNIRKHKYARNMLFPRKTNKNEKLMNITVFNTLIHPIWT